jgi:hypothetical protein
MTQTSIQASFAAGEVSPAFWGRVDQAKFRIGASTMRNMFAGVRGGAYSRGGTHFCGQARQPASAGSIPPRIIPFQFKVNQNYILEFGDGYVRFIANGGYITETPIAITAATQANPCVLTIPGHDFVNGDWIFVAGVGGMTQLNGVTFVVAFATASTVALHDTFGNPVSSLAYAAYTAGGSAARVYTIAAPYHVSDLPYLKYTESADLMSLALSNQVAGIDYAPVDLDRLAANNWTLNETSFASAIAAPAACFGTASAAPSGTLPSAQYAYCATAVSADGEESVASPIALVSSVDISITAGSITLVCSTVPTAVSYNFYKAPAAIYINGGPPQTVPIGSQFGFAGSSAAPTFLDQNVVADASTTPPLHQDPFAPGQILAVGAITSTGTFAQATTTATINTTTGFGAAITPVVSGSTMVAAIVVNAGQNYAVGNTITFLDTTNGGSATAPLVIGPQAGTYPGVVTYFQQRRGYMSSLNNPDTYYFSQTGAFTNMDTADPPIASDAITGTPWAQQVNGLQWAVQVPAGLLIYTGLDAWLLSGASGPATPIEPASQNATSQESIGFSPTVPPIKISYQVITLDSSGSIVSAQNYNYFTNTYAGDDITVFSNHLFDGHQIVQWAWARKPHKVLWAVRDDGVLLSLTYLKEQEVIAWARHDTNGQVVGIATASELPVDAIYLVVKRLIAGKGAYGYFVERMDNRIWTNATSETVWCVDAGVALPQPAPAATLSIGALSGAGVPFSASAAVFDGVNTGVPGQVIRANGGKAAVTQFVSPTQVLATVTVAFAATPDDPAMTPLPAAAGAWTITTPVASVSGLNHLEGMTVTGLADGAVITPAVVTNGAIALGVPASAVTIGLGFQAQLQTLHLVRDGEQLQGKRKRINAVTVRLERSRGVKIGSDQPNASAQEGGNGVATWGARPYGKMILVPETQNQIGPGAALPLFTGDHRIEIDGDFNYIGWSAAPGMVALQQDFPLPMQVLAVVPEYEVGDEEQP